MQLPFMYYPVQGKTKIKCEDEESKNAADPTHAHFRLFVNMAVALTTVKIFDSGILVDLVWHGIKICSETRSYILQLFQTMNAPLAVTTCLKNECVFPHSTHKQSQKW